ncbi:hypothetical protein DY000_02036319 [Brassica cretica]|uniref:Uncharacterized protein n=1 Tax=Brassica cretica TaxID=69181 RepID=A0ABQ7BD17_BRACR|nr:hypothetical protein DY000_02036319 [Brassica cretica]
MLDAWMFDSTEDMDNRKRKQKICCFFLVMFPSRASEKWMEKKELAEQEAVKSLKAFRWRDYWQCSSACVVSLGDSSFGEEEVGEKEDMGNGKENNMLYGILLQVLSLAKFIIKSGSRPLEGYEKPELSTVQILLQQSVAKDLTELELPRTPVKNQ